MAPAVFCWPELCFAVGSFLGEAEGVRTATVNRPWARSVRLLLLRQRGRLAAEVEAVAARLAAEPKSEGGHWGAVLRTARAALTARCAAAQLQLQIARVDIRIAALAPESGSACAAPSPPPPRGWPRPRSRLRSWTRLRPSARRPGEPPQGPGLVQSNRAFIVIFLHPPNPDPGAFAKANRLQPSRRI
eukprot:TRINITY_DN27690_c0_g1_i2.p2 TRINITY_DN27690_c0_g1~~TRINITY_DN27690_c0_g1_i2.p2  ORF type:complete len:207 (+),score=43.54 TRINITY_DN27690_c0_g1_i2:58-621(+)